MPLHRSLPTREFVGAEGAEALSRTGTDFEPLDGAPFRARIVVVTLDRTRVTSMEITPHRAVMRRESGSNNDDVVLFHFVLAGRLSGQGDRVSARSTEGSIRFVRGNAPWRYVSRGPAHVVAWWVDLHLLRTDVADALRYATTREFRNDAIALACTAIIRSIMTTPPKPHSDAARIIESVLISQIEAAVLSADAHRIDPEAAGRNLFAELRELFASDLTRTSVRLDELARELNTSPAVLGRALSAQGLTARQLLIEMRVDELARLLRDPLVEDSLAGIAARAGFAGIAQAARAFRAQHDTTMHRYRAMMRGE